MKNDWLYIFIPLLIQGQYDFNFWYGYFDEASGHAWEWFYRLCKETIDIPVTAAILYFWCGWDVNLISAFFIMKVCGWSDAFYIVIWKLFHPKQNYTAEGIWWMWWTPLAWFRNQFVKSIELSTFKENEVMQLGGRWWWIKGKITLREMQIQLAVAMIVSFLVYHFGVVTWLVHKLILLMY